MAYKIVDTKGKVYSHHASIEEAERELEATLEATDTDPSTTFMSASSPYRIVEENREWAFNSVTNRYEWIVPTAPPNSGE